MIRGLFLKRSRSYKIMQNVKFHVKLLSPTLNMLKADSHVFGNRIKPKRKLTICYWWLFFMTVFIRRAPVEDNTASACMSIGTVAGTYGCKILQLYEYYASVYGYDANFEWHPKNTSSCSVKDSLLPGWGYFCISLNSTRFKIKINDKKYYVFMKITPLIGRRIRISRRPHVNQP